MSTAFAAHAFAADHDADITLARMTAATDRSLEALRRGDAALAGLAAQTAATMARRLPPAIAETLAKRLPLGPRPVVLIVKETGLRVVAHAAGCDCDPGADIRRDVFCFVATDGDVAIDLLRKTFPRAADRGLDFVVLALCAEQDIDTYKLLTRSKGGRA